MWRHNLNCLSIVSIQTIDDWNLLIIWNNSCRVHWKTVWIGIYLMKTINCGTLSRSKEKNSWVQNKTRIPILLLTNTLSKSKFYFSPLLFRTAWKNFKKFKKIFLVYWISNYGESTSYLVLRLIKHVDQHENKPHSNQNPVQRVHQQHWVILLGNDDQIGGEVEFIDQRHEVIDQEEQNQPDKKGSMRI